MRHDDYPELGVVKTATPCSADWDRMQGDDVRRFCAKCERYVYDFSQLTTNEARQLLIETEGRLCARIFTRADGTVLTKDCPVGRSRRTRMKVGAAAAAAALTGAAITAATATRTTCELPPPSTTSSGEQTPRAIESSNPRNQMLGGLIVIEDPKRKL